MNYLNLMVQERLFPGQHQNEIFVFFSYKHFAFLLNAIYKNILIALGAVVIFFIWILIDKLFRSHHMNIDIFII